MEPLREVAPEQKIARVSGFVSMSICLLYLTALFLGGDSKSKGQLLFPRGVKDPCATRTRQSNAWVSSTFSVSFYRSGDTGDEISWSTVSSSSLQPRAIVREKWEPGTSCLLICMPEMPLGEGLAGMWPPILLHNTRFAPCSSLTNNFKNQVRKLDDNSEFPAAYLQWHLAKCLFACKA